jgi:hypothetical protein
MLGESIRRRRGLGRKRGTETDEQREQSPGGPRLRWQVWVPAALGAVLLSFGLGYLIAVRMLFPPPAVPAIGVQVPDVIGLSAAEAQRAIMEVGLTLDSVTRMPHPRTPQGVVLAQTPVGGQQVRNGGGVGVAVSIGPARALVPDVRGFTADRAAELLGRRGFQVSLRERLSDEPAGEVVGVEPAAGTELQLPAAVTLHVSMGPPLPPPLEEDTVLFQERIWP